MDKVKEARELFGIEEFPGNFFELKSFIKYFEEHRILVFKEPIGKLSGFIGYGLDELTVICINYQRPIGHQNFTFAHELGHWMLHKGISYSDDNSQLSFSNENVEKEANFFANKILYPQECLDKDYNFIVENNLLSKGKEIELAVFIDELCHRYCMSYQAVLNNILKEANQWNRNKTIKEEIKKALGMNWSDYFQKDFYCVDYDNPNYQRLRAPYEYMDKMIEYLLKNNEISIATAESIRMKNKLDFNN